MAEITRDVDGKILHNSLSSEEAAAMARQRWAKPKEDRVNALLRARGIDPEGADEGLRTLAEIATGNRSGAIASMRYLDALCGFGTQANDGQAHQVEVLSENAVRVDGATYFRIPPTYWTPAEIQDALNRVRRAAAESGCKVDPVENANADTGNHA